MKALLGDGPWRLLDPSAFAPLGEIEENGATFEDNACLKAKAVARHTGHFALADDSGLEVDALDGRPGILSARFSLSFGLPPGDGPNCEKLLELLRDVPDAARGAQFVCAAALAAPWGATLVRRGEWRGAIARVPAGQYGFGYDPLFVPEGMGVTVAEMTVAEKNATSHRARAFAALRRDMEAFLRNGE